MTSLRGVVVRTHRPVIVVKLSYNPVARDADTHYERMRHTHVPEMVTVASFVFSFFLSEVLVEGFDTENRHINC